MGLVTRVKEFFARPKSEAIDRSFSTISEALWLTFDEKETLAMLTAKYTDEVVRAGAGAPIVYSDLDLAIAAAAVKGENYCPQDMPIRLVAEVGNYLVAVMGNREGTVSFMVQSEDLELKRLLIRNKDESLWRERMPRR